MSIIPTVPSIDNKKLTDLARSLIKYTEGDTRLLKAVNLVIDGGVPRVETFSFDELEGLINILDLSRPIKAKLDPAQWVVMTYQLNDLDALLVDGYRLTEYTLDLDAHAKKLVFTGVITHIKAIANHPSYDPAYESSPKEFEFTLEDFDMIQQMSITRAMASNDEKFLPVAGTIDVSWLYEFNNGQISFATKDVE